MSANSSAAAERVFSGESSGELVFPHPIRDLSLYERKETNQEYQPDTDKLSGLYNKFKGERCFILGNGPSLNKHDLSLLEDEYTFAVNSFFYKTEETNFRPTFFVVEDNMVMRENIDKIREYQAPYKFFPADYKALHPAEDNTFFFRMNQGFYQKSSPYYCVPRFSVDVSKVIYCGQSVTYANLQLAFYMGFTEVFLIGMDFSYVLPKAHQVSGNHILSTTDDPNHFHKDYFGKGKTWKDPKLDRVALSYRQAKLSFESVGRKIYNATIGGQLEIFDRVDYEELLVRGRKTIPAKESGVAAPAAVSQGAVPTNDHPAQTPPRNNRVAGRVQFFGDALRGLWRRRWRIAPGLLVIGFTLGLGFTELGQPHQELLWFVAAYLSLAMGVGYLALRLYQYVRALSTELTVLRSRTDHHGKRFNELSSLLNGLSARQTEIQKSLEVRSRAVERRFVSTASEYRLELERLSSELGGRIDAAEMTFERGSKSLEAELLDFSRAAGMQAERLEGVVSGLSDHAAQIAAQDVQLTTQSARSVSLDLLSALRALRPLWLGGGSVDRFSRERVVEHGHSVLMAVLADEVRADPAVLSGKTLVEIGTTRELRPAQRSTQKLMIFAAATDMSFVTVDMDPKNTESIRTTLPYINPAAQAETARGEDYLRDSQAPYHYVYLDAFDVDHGEHSDERQASYRKNLGTTINDTECWKMHLECAEAILERMPVGGIVALDDTWRSDNGGYEGKGKLAAPLLLSNGFEVIAATEETLCLKRVDIGAGGVRLNEAVESKPSESGVNEAHQDQVERTLDDE